MLYTSRRHIASALVALPLAALTAGCPAKPTQRPQPVAPATPEASGNPGPSAAKPATEPPAPPLPPPHTTPPTPAQFAAPPVAGDWTGYLGDTRRSGTRQVPAIRIPRIAWSTRVGIQGYANTPLVTPSAVIVGSQGSEWNKPDADDAVLALDPKTGAQLWRVPADSDVNGIGLYGSTVIFGTDNGTLVALDAQNGNTRWSTPTGCPLRHPPALVGGQLHLLRESGLASVSAETGKGPQELPPCRRSDRGGLSVADDVIYASANNRPLAAYRDGRELWRVASPSPTLTSFVAWTPPYVGAELLLQSVQRWTFDGTQGVATEPALLAVWRDNGQVAWAARVNAPDIVDPTGNLPGDPHFKMPPWVAGDRAFVASNAGPVLEAFNLADGSRAGTIKLPDCRTRQFGGIVGTPDMGYFARHDGVVYGFSPSRMAIEWSLSVGLHAAAGGRSTHFVAPAGCSPEPADGTALFAPPALGADGTLYVGSGDGWLYAITDASTAASPR